MRKFLFDPDGLVGLDPRPNVSLPAGMPFVLDDTFSPVEELNQWLYSLRERGCHSPRTWSGYADDLIAWTRFLAQKDLRLLDHPDTLLTAVADYREARLQGEPGGSFSVLQHDAWNRAVSAMENYYSWAVEKGRIPGKPFQYKEYRLTYGERAGETVRHNYARARAGSRTATLLHLAEDWADLYIYTGLGGALPDGEPDPLFRGRLATRNRAVGSLVRSSGLRRQEFANLLVWELPRSLGPFSEFVALPVPGKIAKGSRSRTTWASGRALEDVADYIVLERTMSVSGSTWLPKNPLYVTDPTPTYGIVNGRRVKWASLSINQRRRLVAPDGGSALLFVRGDGGPLEETNWRYTFDVASARCQQFVSRFPEVTPHVLRHTFAVETLNMLTRNAMSRAERLARVTGADPLLMAILRRNDPLLILRDLLGHASLTTTEIYLAAQDPTTILTDAELDALADEEDEDFDESWDEIAS